MLIHLDRRLLGISLWLLLLGGILLLWPVGHLGLLGQVVLLLEVLHPWMVEDFDKGQSLVCFVDEDLVDKVLVLVGQPGLEPDLASHDLVANLPGVHASEGRPTVHQLVQKDTERPDVERVIVVLILDHLGRHVLECTAEGVTLLHVVRLDAPAEITNLDDVTVLN